MVRARDVERLRLALGAMAERGLDCDDASIDAAQALRADLEAQAGSSNRRGGRAAGQGGRPTPPPLPVPRAAGRGGWFS